MPQAKAHQTQGCILRPTHPHPGDQRGLWEEQRASGLEAEMVLPGVVLLGPRLPGRPNSLGHPSPRVPSTLRSSYLQPSPEDRKGQQ